jgi:hypothetical protein
VEQGPPVNLLSGAQLRLLARIRTLRPTAELQWEGDGEGWSLKVVEVAKEHAPRHLLEARLNSDGTIETTRAWF